jgi:hypothetical protein
LVHPYNSSYHRDRGRRSTYKKCYLKNKLKQKWLGGSVGRALSSNPITAEKKVVKIQHV